MYSLSVGHKPPWTFAPLWNVTWKDKILPMIITKMDICIPLPPQMSRGSHIKRSRRDMERHRKTPKRIENSFCVNKFLGKSTLTLSCIVCSSSSCYMDVLHHFYSREVGGEEEGHCPPMKRGMKGQKPPNNNYQGGHLHPPPPTNVKRIPRSHIKRSRRDIEKLQKGLKTHFA